MNPDDPLHPDQVFRGLRQDRRRPKGSRRRWTLVITGLVVATVVAALTGGWWQELVTNASLSPEPAESAAKDAPKSVTQTKRTRVTTPQKSKKNTATVKRKPQTTPKRRVASKGKGRVVFVVRPWAEVYVDGRKIGVTPVAPRKLSEGNHTIRLVNPKLRKSKELRVYVPANKTVRINETLK